MKAIDWTCRLTMLSVAGPPEILGSSMFSDRWSSAHEAMEARKNSALPKGAYALAAGVYRQAGWKGIVPLSHGQKRPAREGFTGKEGREPTDREIDSWVVECPKGNVALALPDGCCGIDVDEYDNKHGGASLASLEERWGPLPRTFISTARPMPSGIRLYHIPPGTKLNDKPADHIEIIQRHHRYICVWPSTNPLAHGAPYHWITPDGEITERPPRPDQIPELPARWLEGLTTPKAQTPQPDGSAASGAARLTLTDVPNGCDDRSPAVGRALSGALSDLHGGRHDATLVGVLALTRLAERGHPGADAALEDLHDAFLCAVAHDGTRMPGEAEKEWTRMLTGAKAEVATTPATTPSWEELKPEPDPTSTGQVTVAAALEDADANPRQSAAGVGVLPLLEVLDLREVAARVDAAPPPGYLIRPFWPQDAYGAIGAEKKAGKTWLILDMAVSVASGTNWLGCYSCDRPGPVLVFLGEGGERKMIRRLRAIAEDRGLRVEDLAIRLCFRVPHLSAGDHLACVAAELAAHPPALVIVDPMYLAAKGAKSSDLVEMGAQLEPLQLVCQQAGAALAVVHHWNKTGVGSGAERFSGAGLAEWGRVLISVAVVSKSTDPSNLATAVVLSLSISGDEVGDDVVRILRRVWADDHTNLGSAMHYHVEPDQGDSRANNGERPTDLMESLSAALIRQGPNARLAKAEVEGLVPGNALRKRRAIGSLVQDGYFGIVDGPHNAILHYSLKPYVEADDIRA